MRTYAGYTAIGILAGVTIAAAADAPKAPSLARAAASYLALQPSSNLSATAAFSRTQASLQVASSHGPTSGASVSPTVTASRMVASRAAESILPAKPPVGANSSAIGPAPSAHMVAQSRVNFGNPQDGINAQVHPVLAQSLTGTRMSGLNTAPTFARLAPGASASAVQPRSGALVVGAQPMPAGNAASSQAR